MGERIYQTNVSLTVQNSLLKKLIYPVSNLKYILRLFILV